MLLEIIKFDERHEHLIAALTELLHEAYSVLSYAGMTATAQQNSEATTRRLKSGDSFLGFVDSKLVGTITVVRKATEDPVAWFSKPGIFHITQFAVDSRTQGKGYRMEVLKFAESFAKSEGAIELALDTSERAESLISWYKKRGYRFVEHCNLPTATYRSVVLSKNLAD